MTKDVERNTQNNIFGITLFDLLSVLGIISILAAFLLPAISHIKSRTRTAICVTQVRQLALAVCAYSNDFEGNFPTTLYGSIIQKYYTNPSKIIICPDDLRSFDNASLTRGSYGLNQNILNYKLTSLPENNLSSNKPLAILGDAVSETLGTDSFKIRHRGKGNIAFLDGHVETILASNLQDYL